MYPSRETALTDAIEDASHEQVNPRCSATTTATGTPESVPWRYASITVPPRPPQTARAARTQSAPQITGVQSTVRVTVTNGRRASGARKVALSNPASANTAVSARTTSSPAPPPGGSATGVGTAGTRNSVRMNASEHASTSRIAWTANLIPRTTHAPITQASTRYNGSAGTETPAPWATARIDCPPW